MKVAALYVDPKGAYSGLPDVEPWGLPDRDAMAYEGPHRVVAHPPCKLAGLVEARWGHERGDDGGTFAAALASIRRYGGVIEHPAYSAAWKAHGINWPPTGFAGWVNADFEGGWTCYVEQGSYGHPARKATWLLAYGVDLPALRWGYDNGKASALVSQCANFTKPGDDRQRLSPVAASRTPEAFRDALLGIARSSR